MYNRYIPQPDGSFSRSRIENKPEPSVTKPERPAYKAEAPSCPEQKKPPKPEPDRSHSKSERKEQTAFSFLQNLLPRDLDTGDLIVILLLLLLAGDCEEDRSTAMLTLAIYLFM